MSKQKEHPEMSGEPPEQPPSLAKRVRDWAPWEIIIPLSPTIGYAWAYMHELGFASVFGIPTDLIRIDLTSILRATIIVFLFLLLVFSLLVIVYGLSRGRGKSGGVVGQNILYMVPPLLGLFLWLVSSHPSAYQVWLPPLALLLFLFVYSFILFILKSLMTPLKRLVKWLMSHLMYPVKWLMSHMMSFLVSRTNVKGLIDKLRVWYENESAQLSEFDDAPFAYLRKYKQSVPVVLGLLALIGLGLFASYEDGEASAMAQRYFWVSDNQQAVVLRFYGNELVCAPSDNTTENGFKKTFFVIKMDDDPRPVLILKLVRH